jgi:hypothetical protein
MKTKEKDIEKKMKPYAMAQVCNPAGARIRSITVPGQPGQKIILQTSSRWKKAGFGGIPL